MKRYDFPKNKSNLLGHIVYTPNRCKEGLPLIVMLHGAGERGNGTDELGKVTVHGIGKYCDNGTMNLDAIVLCPQCPEGNVWNKLTTELKSLIDKVAAKYKVDMKKISITGLSMGGFGTWEMALTYPSFFSCFAPICGGGMAWRCWGLKGKKIWTFHGDVDDTVNISNSIDMVNVCRAAGADVKFTIFSGVAHNSWEPAYLDTKVVDWLISNSL